MRNGLLILNIILLIAVGVLFYLHFSSGNKQDKKPDTVAAGNQSAPAGSEVRIAYIEMDSLESAFAMIRDVKNELTRKEESMNNELSGLEKKYRDKAAVYQGQAATMNQMQSEAATKDMMQLQQTIQSRKQDLDQEYQNLYMGKMKDVKSKIEDFLKEYNKDKRYTYILAYEPGLFYYKDTTYNITGDVIRGLNKRYKK
jgi:outer membrane protein